MLSCLHGLGRAQCVSGSKHVQVLAVDLTLVRSWTCLLLAGLAGGPLSLLFLLLVRGPFPFLILLLAGTRTWQTVVLRE